MVDDSQRKLVAEFFGTFALIFFGAGSALLGADVVGQALANGLAIGLMVTAVGHISGGHFNPAVTLSMLVTRPHRDGRGGALLDRPAGRRRGCGAVLLAIYPDTGSLGSPAVGDPFSTGNALVAEIVTTFFLVFVIYAVAVDKRGAFSILAGLPIGLTISISVLAVGVVSGAALNPARWFGPALVSGTWDNFWIWILGPAIGAILAGARVRPAAAQGHTGGVATSPLIPCGGTAAAVPPHGAIGRDGGMSGDSSVRELRATGLQGSRSARPRSRWSTARTAA